MLVAFTALGLTACTVSVHARLGPPLQVVALLWIYVHYSAPVTSWGDVTQALIYHQVRKYLLRLDERRAHPKFWRPSVLLLVSAPALVYPQHCLRGCCALCEQARGEPCVSCGWVAFCTRHVFVETQLTFSCCFFFLSAI